MLPVTRDEKLLEERMLRILNSHPYGIFSSQFTMYYQEEFKESLPEDWMRIVNGCSEIIVETGVNNTSILMTRPKVRIFNSIKLVPFNVFIFEYIFSRPTQKYFHIILGPLKLFYNFIKSNEIKLHFQNENKRTEHFLCDGKAHLFKKIQYVFRRFFIFMSFYEIIHFYISS